MRRVCEESAKSLRFQKNLGITELSPLHENYKKRQQRETEREYGSIWRVKSRLRDLLTQKRVLFSSPKSALHRELLTTVCSVRSVHPVHSVHSMRLSESTRLRFQCGL